MKSTEEKAKHDTRIKINICVQTVKGMYEGRFKTKITKKRKTKNIKKKKKE